MNRKGRDVMYSGVFYEVTPHAMGVKEIEAKIPIRDGWLFIKVKDGKVVKEDKRF